MNHLQANTSKKIPLILLGGSDEKAGPVPADLNEGDMLRGNKGLMQLPNGKTLADELVTRFRTSGCFQEPVLIGPAEEYENKISCEIENSHGDLSMTLSHVNSLIRERYSNETSLAICATDILPTVDEIQKIMRESYQPNCESAFWCQLIRSEPDEMGASSWKPNYLFKTEQDSQPVIFYPGHLVIIDPKAIRIKMMIHLLKIAYQHRNIELSKRPRSLLFAGLWELIREDFQNLFRCQLPVLSWSIPYHALTGYRRFRKKELTIPELGNIVAHMFLHRKELHERKQPAVFSVSDIRSFAKDIDTKAEWEEIAHRI